MLLKLGKLVKYEQETNSYKIEESKLLIKPHLMLVFTKQWHNQGQAWTGTCLPNIECFTVHNKLVSSVYDKYLCKVLAQLNTPLLQRTII